jgi:hypothetical protein
MAKVKITGHASGSGVFTITAPNSNTDRTITLPDASVTLGTDATKLPLAGGTLTGDLILGDDVKLEVGNATGGDLQVWHDGTNSHIKNTTGTLFINSDGMTKLQDAGANETFAVFNDNGASELYHDNSKKIETTATGATVTGAVTADSSLIRGAVVQVQGVHVTPSGTITSAGSLSELSSTLRVAITPKHASSKLIHEFYAPYNMPNSTHLQWAYFRNYTDSAIELGSASAGSRKSTHWGARTSDTDANDFDNLSMRMYQTANSTNARTYTIFHGTEGATASFGVSPLSSGSGATWPLVYTITEIYNP